ncbi:hypothetical protein [Mycobacterium sp.]|uniref:hypothetical protein n=1 Tax=Mycobacterium sp. TaxID=1785 RepID=UPI00122A468B|nr:hypothetical protein [Mycobacterium sp.]TAM64705.1 MAG: hypothetical protein EPN51_22945 [Mycobacterium sp.]
MSSSLYGLLTVIFLALVLVFASVAAVFVKRLGDRETTPIGEEIRSAKVVVAKVRKRQPMSEDEFSYAKRILTDRSSPMAFCIPGALFSVGCFYVFGSLYHLHGATPSERTFLGVFPMLASLNFTTQLLRHARLKRRLQNSG